MKKKIIILGGDGDGVVVAQTVMDVDKYDQSMCCIGFLNDNIDIGDSIIGSPVLGKLKDWDKLEKDVYFHAALHKVKEMKQRSFLIEGLGIPKNRWLTIIHPTATVADNVQIDEGSYIGSHVTIQPNVKIGRFVTIRAGANIGHDAIIEDFSYLGPNSTMTGRSCLKLGSHLGPNAVIADGVSIGQYSVLGIGAAALIDIDEYSVYIGNPARKVSCIER